MPHQCVRCNTFYEDGSKEILKGCSCGGKLFFYVSKEKLKKAKQVTSHLSLQEKKQIEADVFEIIGDERDRDRPVILDFESISIKGEGKYDLDLVNLFSKKQPVIYKLEDGKYLIDIAATFEKMRKKK